MRIGLLNTRSMRKKLLYISESLMEFDIDVLCLTETWLMESDHDLVKAELPNSYSMVQVPRDSHGGGVAVIYRRSFSNVKVSPLDCISSFELIEVSLTFNSQTVRLAVVYRPGVSGSDLDFLREFGLFMEDFSSKHGNLLICGDFNYWVDDPLAKPYSAEFLELVEQYSFANHVRSSTHLSGHTLDLVLSPVDSDYVGEVDVVPVDTRVSDHSLIVFAYNQPKPLSYRKLISFTKYNIDSERVLDDMQHSLYSIDTSALGVSELVQIHCDFFRAVKNCMCHEISKWITVKDDAPWYDSSIAQLRRERRRLERQWRRLRTDWSRRQYVEARGIVVSRINACKTQHYKNKISACNGDQKKLFSVFNDLLGRKTLDALPIYSSGAEMAVRFSQFFTLKIMRIRENLALPSVNQEMGVSLQPQPHAVQFLRSFRPVSAGDVVTYIKQSKKTFCLLDPINVAKIETVYEASAAFLADIINKCFSESNFVCSEKCALVRPLLKKAGLDQEDLSNYRPVSNLSFLSKLIERAILVQLVEFIEENIIIPMLQSAYRKYHGVETALCKVHNDLVVNVCSGRSSLLILLDLSAAFDTIDHEMLLGDLYEIGICDSALALFRSYLSDRFQKVNINGEISDGLPLQCGVPQGSLLGPVLFTIYMSSLASLLEAHGVGYHFYADDTQFYIEVVDMQDAKNKIVALLMDLRVWMQKRKLKLNNDKTEIMIVRGTNRSVRADVFGSIGTGGVDLVPSDSVRNLGVIFDESLNFVKHINLLVRDCNYHMRNIGAIRRYLDRNSVITVLHSLVLSRIDFCNSLYNHLPQYLLRRLQSVLNRAARIVYCVPPRTPTTPFLLELHWLPVKARIQFKLCLLTYKVLKYGEPKYLAELLSPAIRVFDMALRSSDDPFHLCEPRAIGERSFAERSFSYSAPRLYNKLPVEIKQLETVDLFKRHLKTYFFLLAYDVESGCMTADFAV